MYVASIIYFVDVNDNKHPAGTRSNGLPLAPYLNLLQKNYGYTKKNHNMTQQLQQAFTYNSKIRNDSEVTM
jgi:hypothetical protein